MAKPEDWQVAFYMEGSRSPVREFLQNLDTKTRARFAWSIEQLRLRNIRAREPLVKHLRGKIWELREEGRTDIYRLLYSFMSGRRIVFLHGFQKKSQRTPSREIEIAERRLTARVQREGGES